KQTLAQAARVECQGGQQENPHDVGRGGPGIMGPFILVVSDVGKRNPGEVGTAEEAGHAPQGRAAHQVAGMIGLPSAVLRSDIGSDLTLCVLYLPLHFGSRFSRKAMIPSRASAVEMSSSR